MDEIEAILEMQGLPDRIVQSLPWRCHLHKKIVNLNTVIV